MWRMSIAGTHCQSHLTRKKQHHHPKAATVETGVKQSMMHDGMHMHKVR
jgi:hypothetical protein